MRDVYDWGGAYIQFISDLFTILLIILNISEKFEKIIRDIDDDANDGYEEHDDGIDLKYSFDDTQNSHKYE